MTMTSDTSHFLWMFGYGHDLLTIRSDYNQTDLVWDDVRQDTEVEPVKSALLAVSGSTQTVDF